MHFLSQISSFLLLAATISNNLVLAIPVAEVESNSETKQLARRVIPTVQHTREGDHHDYIGDDTLPGLPKSAVENYAKNRAEKWYNGIPKENGKDPVKVMAVLCVEGAGCWGGTGQ
jgi:hypothetical protein